VGIRVIVCALAGAVLLCAPVRVVAHHGAATFDTSGEVTVKGTVTEWIWSNPHCFLKFDVKGADGTVKNWAVETGNIADASKRGWQRRSFKVGDQVTVTLQAAKSGAPVGRVRTVVLADGTKLE
jgi:uncharacterized protein DUF6152